MELDRAPLEILTFIFSPLEVGPPATSIFDMLLFSLASFLQIYLQTACTKLYFNCVHWYAFEHRLANGTGRSREGSYVGGRLVWPDEIWKQGDIWIRFGSKVTQEGELFLEPSFYWMPTTECFCTLLTSNLHDIMWRHVQWAWYIFIESQEHIAHSLKRVVYYVLKLKGLRVVHHFQ